MADYTVVSGDSLWAIWRDMGPKAAGISWDDFLAMNSQITNPSLIHVGDVVHMDTSTTSSTTSTTTSGTSYTVVSGDSPWAIWRDKGPKDAGMTWDEFVALNNLTGDMMIHPGDTILLSSGGTEDTSAADKAAADQAAADKAAADAAAAKAAADKAAADQAAADKAAADAAEAAARQAEADAAAKAAADDAARIAAEREAANAAAEKAAADAAAEEAARIAADSQAAADAQAAEDAANAEIEAQRRADETAAAEAAEAEAEAARAAEEQRRADEIAAAAESAAAAEAERQAEIARQEEEAAAAAERTAAEQALAEEAAAAAEAERKAAAEEAARIALEERRAAIAKLAEDNRLTGIMLETFPWLNDIPGIYLVVFEGMTDDLPDEIILANIRDTDGYKNRFPGMELRVGNDFNPINEFEYLQLEDTYRGLLSSYGISHLAEDDDGIIPEWIGGDVSPVELSTRLDEGWAAMTDAAPAVKEAFQNFYGITPDDATLLTYFLDRDLGINEMENIVASSQVGGAALQYGYNITRTRAELLRSEGISYEMARSGYADIAREDPQLNKLAQLHSYSPMSQEDLENMVFHEDPNVIQRRYRIFDAALAEFSGSGAASLTDRGALSELVDTDLTV